MASPILRKAIAADASFIYDVFRSEESVGIRRTDTATITPISNKRVTQFGWSDEGIGLSSHASIVGNIRDELFLG